MLRWPAPPVAALLNFFRIWNLGLGVGGNAAKRVA